MKWQKGYIGLLTRYGRSLPSSHAEGASLQFAAKLWFARAGKAGSRTSAYSARVSVWPEWPQHL